MHHHPLQLLLQEEVKNFDAVLTTVGQNRLQEGQRKSRYWVKPWLTRRKAQKLHKSSLFLAVEVIEKQVLLVCSIFVLSASDSTPTPSSSALSPSLSSAATYRTLSSPHFF
jgi:hypothetical protein